MCPDGQRFVLVIIMDLMLLFYIRVEIFSTCCPGGSDNSSVGSVMLSVSFST